jgi:hypothetical protein
MAEHTRESKRQNYNTADGGLPDSGTNPKYDPKGTLKSYMGDPNQFPNPEGVKLYEGFGADASDLVRGYCDPGIAELPDYDKVNYQERWVEPSSPTEGPGDTMSLPEDYEFRMRERKSRGFLTRPRIPTERN